MAQALRKLVAVAGISGEHQSVEQLFGVHVEGVWTSNRRGKTRRVGRSVGARSNWKKAIVRLREGETIEEIFEG